MIFMAKKFSYMYTNCIVNRGPILTCWNLLTAQGATQFIGQYIVNFTAANII
jgi:hypothetical protein